MSTLAPVSLTADAIDALKTSTMSTATTSNVSIPMSGIERTIISVAIALMLMSIFVVLFYQRPVPVEPLSL